MAARLADLSRPALLPSTVRRRGGPAGDALGHVGHPGRVRQTITSRRCGCFGVLAPIKSQGLLRREPREPVLPWDVGSQHFGDFASGSQFREMKPTVLLEAWCVLCRRGRSSCLAVGAGGEDPVGIARGRAQVPAVLPRRLLSQGLLPAGIANVRRVLAQGRWSYCPDGLALRYCTPHPWPDSFAEGQG